LYCATIFERADLALSARSFSMIFADVRELIWRWMD